jgi:hypothetical protein
LEDADDKLGGDRSEGAGRRGHRDGCNFRAPGPGVGTWMTELTEVISNGVRNRGP